MCAAIQLQGEVIEMQKRITIVKKGIGKHGIAAMSCCAGGVGSTKK